MKAISRYLKKWTLRCKKTQLRPTTAISYIIRTLTPMLLQRYLYRSCECLDYLVDVFVFVFVFVLLE